MNVRTGWGGLARSLFVWCKRPFFEKKNFLKKKIFKNQEKRCCYDVYARVCTRICVSLYIKYILYI